MRTENEVFYIDRPHRLSLKDVVKYCIYPFYNVFLKFMSLLFTKDRRATKYKVSVCTCFKNEAPFIKEWIEYHLFIGVEHFYLYNNNSTDHYQDILDPYVQSGVVTILDFPVVPVQVAAYKHFYDNFRNETQWVAFIDIDEFICLKKDESIISWLSKFSKYPLVYMYWKYFGSNGLLEHDESRTVMEQYTCATDKYINIGKVFYNTRYDIAKFDKSMVHFMLVNWHGILIPAVNEAMNFSIWGIQKIKNKQFTLQLNHYWSKAFNQYIRKYKNGSAAFGDNWKKIWVYKETEHLCKSPDYTIFRFLTEVKLHIKGIDENTILDK